MASRAAGAGAPAELSGPDPRSLSRARVAVAACFFLNAVFYAGLVPRLPEVKARLELSSTALGAALAALPLGALMAGLAAGVLVRRLGSGRLASGGLVLLGLAIAAVGVAPNWPALAAVLLLAGALDAVIDVAQNAHGLRVQRLYRRSIINSFHGYWSIGAVTGGVIGSLAAGAGISLPLQLGLAAVLLGMVAVGASRWLLPDKDGAPPADGADGADDPGGRVGAAVTGQGSTPGSTKRRAVLSGLAVLGLLAACGAVVEDAGSSWSALYLRTELGAGPVAAGAGFVALSVAMTLGRLTGDRVVDRFGQRRVARAGGALIAVALGTALAFPSVPGTVAAFALAGLGVATLVPAVYQAADSLPGLPPGRGLAAVNWLLRIGFLTAPVVVGAVADALSLRVALLGVVLAGGVVLALGRALPG